MFTKAPKGRLIIIGGDEEKGTENNKNKTIDHQPRMEILRALVPLKKKNPQVVLITTASIDPIEVSRIYKAAFRKIGVKGTSSINLSHHPLSMRKSFIERIKKADTVLFSGGDQFRLSTILGNTKLLDAVKDKYMNSPGFTVAGTSAGAMAVANLMIFESSVRNPHLKGSVKVSAGLGIIDSCIVDTHLKKRGRFDRLAQTVVMNPTNVGVGLGENTALVIEKGNMMHCIGTGIVIIIDGKEVGHTNISYAKEGEAIFIESLRVHLLCRGNAFLLKERKFVMSKNDLKKERSGKTD